ncbi:MAG: monovalent cation/H(+) antiporter subunit G [Vicinamibacterales bacterium]
MIEWLTLTLMWIGAVFMLLAAVGIARLPDTFTRMQAATKAGTLGVSSMMLATATHFEDVGVTATALLTIAFFFATAPVAAHLIGRVAYFVGAQMWHGTVVDELRQSYEARRRGIGESDDAPKAPDVRPGASDGGD